MRIGGLLYWTGHFTPVKCPVLGDHYTDEFEYYSIDEGFGRVSGNLTALGIEMRKQVRRDTGIPISIGFGKTKTLAKVANYFAKKSPKLKTRGVLDLSDSPYLPVALERLPVEEIWGVGPAYTAFLNRKGITNASHLRDAPEDLIRQHMTIVGANIVRELKGEVCYPLEQVAPNKKLITCSRSFGSATGDLNELRAAVAFYVARAAERLRKQKQVAGSINVFVQTNRFKPNPYGNSTTLSIAPKSDSTRELRDLALMGLEKIYKPGAAIRKAGVNLGGLEEVGKATMRLWDDAEYENQRRLMAAMDRLNTKYGRDTVKCGLFPNEGVWHTRFGSRSPRYTTEWAEICRVR